MHMVLTADHKSPDEFRNKARRVILEGYGTVAIEETHVTSVSTIEDGFVTEDANGAKWQGKKLILATGVTDIYPAIEGYGECWGTGM